MTTPSRPRSPRWSVLLRIGTGVSVFGLFVILFSYGQGPVGFVIAAVGVACLLASVVFYLQDKPCRR